MTQETSFDVSTKRDQMRCSMLLKRQAFDVQVGHFLHPLWKKIQGNVLQMHDFFSSVHNFFLIIFLVQGIVG